MLEEQRKRLEEFLNPLLEERGVDLVELKVYRRGHRVTVEILVDKPSGGITIDECGWINKGLVGPIENELLFADPYTLEVSSPGLDRPLKTEKDFLRVIGRCVRFHLRERVDNKLEHEGVVQNAIDSQVIVVTKTQTIYLPMDKIQKAVQVIS